MCWKMMWKKWENDKNGSPERTTSPVYGDYFHVRQLVVNSIFRTIFSLNSVAICCLGSSTQALFCKTEYDGDVMP